MVTVKKDVPGLKNQILSILREIPLDYTLLNTHFSTQMFSLNLA